MSDVWTGEVYACISFEISVTRTFGRDNAICTPDQRILTFDRDQLALDFAAVTYSCLLPSSMGLSADSAKRKMTSRRRKTVIVVRMSSKMIFEACGQCTKPGLDTERAFDAYETARSGPELRGLVRRGCTAFHQWIINGGFIRK